MPLFGFFELCYYQAGVPFFLFLLALGFWVYLTFPHLSPFPCLTSVNLIYIFLTAWSQILHIREHQQLQNSLRQDLFRSTINLAEKQERRLSLNLAEM